MKKILAGIALAGTLIGLSLPAAAADLPAFPRNEISVGSGLLGYFSGGAPGTGGAWDVRYAFHAIPLLSLEAGYVGGASEAAFSGATVATMLEGDARFNFLPGARVKPYVVAGAGWAAFSGTTTHSDNGTVEFPFGGGADVGLTNRWTAGGRFVYRLTVNDHIGDNRVSADNWQLLGRLAAQF